MKTDLASSIGIAIAGVLISYFVCNLFIGPIDDVSVKTVDSSFTTYIAEPNPELFNYDDNCTEYDDKGECIDAGANNSNQGNQ